MSELERLLIRNGARFLRANKHKLYELDGKLFAVPRGRNGTERDRNKPVVRFLKARLEKP